MKDYRNPAEEYCTHPVQRGRHLGSCDRLATFRVYEPLRARPRGMCTYHRNHGRFAPLPWSRVEEITR